MQGRTIFVVGTFDGVVPAMMAGKHFEDENGLHRYLKQYKGEKPLIVVKIICEPDAHNRLLEALNNEAKIIFSKYPLTQYAIHDSNNKQDLQFKPYVAGTPSSAGQAFFKQASKTSDDLYHAALNDSNVAMRTLRTSAIRQLTHDQIDVLMMQHKKIFAGIFETGNLTGFESPEIYKLACARFVAANKLESGGGGRRRPAAKETSHNELYQAALNDYHAAIKALASPDLLNDTQNSSSLIYAHARNPEFAKIFPVEALPFLLKLAREDWQFTNFMMRTPLIYQLTKDQLNELMIHHKEMLGPIFESGGIAVDDAIDAYQLAAKSYVEANKIDVTSGRRGRRVPPTQDKIKKNDGGNSNEETLHHPEAMQPIQVDYQSAEKDLKMATLYMKQFFNTENPSLGATVESAAILKTHCGTENPSFIENVDANKNGIFRIAMRDVSAAIHLLENESIARHLSPLQLAAIYKKYASDNTFKDAVEQVSRFIHPAASLRELRLRIKQLDPKEQEQVNLELFSFPVRHLEQLETNSRNKRAEAAPQKKLSAPTIRDYTILGIKADATERQIRDAYKEALHKNHPDRGGTGDPGKIADIKEAYLRIMAKHLAQQAPDQQNDGNKNRM